MRRADGRPGTDAGIAMSVTSVPMSLVAALLWFNVLARRKPLLRICREGIEVNVIGSSSWDGVPFVPAVIRIAWLIVSLQGFKRRIAWIPWSTLRNVEVTGPPMMRALAVDGEVVYPSFLGDELTANVVASITFCESEFVAPLGEIADAIRSYHANPIARESLSSLHD